MNVIPIVLTFDSNLSLPAAVCISSLMQAASSETFYDIFVIHAGDAPDIVGLNKIMNAYSNMSIHYRSVGNTFENSYEIRGITKAAYYRLLAAELIPEYDKVIYADVDTVFRLDLLELYNWELHDCYLGGVYALGINTTEDGIAHLASLGFQPGEYIVSGLLLMDLHMIRRDNLIPQFISLANRNFKFQDQDIINIVCKGKIMPLPYIYHMGVESCAAVCLKTDKMDSVYMFDPFDRDPLIYSNIHYNGVKPWNDICPNMDQWWEAYRRSPIYDPKFYFTFYNNKLEYLDQLSLIKRIKILLRYFVFGRKNPK